jgi:hypothetical protein
MNELEWQTCHDPQEMMRWLRQSGITSDRKGRLFACACARRLWGRFFDDRSREAIEVAERYADGLATPKERLHAFQRAGDARKGKPGTGAGSRRLASAFKGPSYHAADLACATLYASSADAAAAVDHRTLATPLIGPGDKAALLRDIFGPLPFREVSVPASVLAWNDGLVGKLAQATYEHRDLPAGTLDPGRLAILADALLEVGCDDDEVLNHCREQGAVHVRGCWLIDLILSKDR